MAPELHVKNHCIDEAAVRIHPPANFGVFSLHVGLRSLFVRRSFCVRSGLAFVRTLRSRAPAAVPNLIVFEEHRLARHAHSNK